MHARGWGNPVKHLVHDLVVSNVLRSRSLMGTLFLRTNVVGSVQGPWRPENASARSCRSCRICEGWLSTLSWPLWKDLTDSLYGSQYLFKNYKQDFMVCKILEDLVRWWHKVLEVGIHGKNLYDPWWFCRIDTSSLTTLWRFCKSPEDVVGSRVQDPWELYQESARSLKILLDLNKILEDPMKTLHDPWILAGRICVKSWRTLSRICKIFEDLVGSE